MNAARNKRSQHNQQCTLVYLAEIHISNAVALTCSAVHEFNKALIDGHSAVRFIRDTFYCLQDFFRRKRIVRTARDLRHCPFPGISCRQGFSFTNVRPYHPRPPCPYSPLLGSHRKDPEKPQPTSALVECRLVYSVCRHDIRFERPAAVQRPASECVPVLPLPGAHHAHCDRSSCCVERVLEHMHVVFDRRAGRQCEPGVFPVRLWPRSKGS